MEKKHYICEIFYHRLLTMRYLLTLLIIVTSLVASAQTDDLSDELSFGLSFESYFDNREYAGVGESGSDLVARLMPSLSWGFGRREALTVGVDWVVPFGDVGSEEDGGVKSLPYYYDIKPLVYYSLKGEHWGVVAGMFPRSEMSMESYSEAFFADNFRFYNNVMSGVLCTYQNGASRFEVACDWTGQPSEATRERFVIYSAANKAFERVGINLGYNLAITHFAGWANSSFSNVVDNILVAPYVEYGNTFGDWDGSLRVGYLQSLQQDRSFEEGWRTPSMVEMGFSIGRWGVTLEERLYLGGNLQPFYDGQTTSDGVYLEYGSALYNGAQDFRTTTGYYNRAAISYHRYFNHDRVRVMAKFITHANGDGLATQQILELTVKLNKRVL